MATTDTAPGSMATGSGSGPGGAGGGGGGDPPRRHYFAKGGATHAPLWLYDLRTAKSYITEWLTARIDQPITLELVRALAHFIWQLGAQGINLGPHLRLVAVHRDDRESWLAPQFLRLGDNPPTVRTFFGMGTTRGYYDTNVEATIQQSAGSSQYYVGDERCNRCKHGQARFYLGGCAQSFYQGSVLNFGACNECAMNGNGARCSFANRPEKGAEGTTPSIQEIQATSAPFRPQHPDHPSPAVRARHTRFNSSSSMGSITLSHRPRAPSAAGSAAGSPRSPPSATRPTFNSLDFISEDEGNTSGRGKGKGKDKGGPRRDGPS